MTALSVLLIITAVMTLYYWADFFLKRGVQVSQDDWYVKFERAFPPADIWMSTCAVVGAVGMLTEQAYGLVFGLLAAGSLIFLALMDITFGMQNNLYRLIKTSNQMRFEVLVNVWTLGLGVALIIYVSPRIDFI
jgi:hypothetical protein